MKAVTEEHYIPEKRYTTTKYVASDGTEFCTEDGCLRHEEHLEVMNHPVFKNCIRDVLIYGDEYRGNLYYLSNEDDYKFLVKHLGLYNISHRMFKSDFYTYGGLNWYLYWCENGVYDDYHYLLNYNVYVGEIEDDLKEWKENIVKKINDVIEKMINEENVYAPE